MIWLRMNFIYLYVNAFFRKLKSRHLISLRADWMVSGNKIEKMPAPSRTAKPENTSHLFESGLKNHFHAKITRTATLTGNAVNFVMNGKTTAKSRESRPSRFDGSLGNRMAKKKSSAPASVPSASLLTDDIMCKYCGVSAPSASAARRNPGFSSASRRKDFQFNHKASAPNRILIQRKL